MADECGVFVATSGKDANDGTKASPVATLGKAIDLARKGTGRVYACAETFAEAVEVPDGLALYGGLRCANDWEHSDEKKTVIAPGADVVPLKLVGGKGLIHLEDVKAEAADAMMPGGSSIAAIADGGSVELVRCEFVAGAGGDGVKGETPTESVGPTDPNNAEIKGVDGAAACMGPVSGNPGGVGATNVICSSSYGGDGGKGRDVGGDSGLNGAPLPNPNPTNKGFGGAGDTGIGCESGEDGALGIACKGAAPPSTGVTIKTGTAGAGGVGEGATGSGAAGVKGDTQELP